MADRPTDKVPAKAKKPAVMAPVARAKAAAGQSAAPVAAKVPAPALVETPAALAAPPVDAPAKVQVMAPQEGPKAEPEAEVASAPAEPAAPSQATPVPAAEPVGHRVSIKELKEKIMATTPNFDAQKVSDTVSTAFTELQDKAKAAYEKGTAAVSEMTDFTKGNVEAVVESGKILADGVQDLGKIVVDEAKAAYEVATADLKEMAAVKSPTELFQLQGKIARRNFDALVAASSKNSEAMLKLASDVFAPLSGRINLAVDKISKAA